MSDDTRIVEIRSSHVAGVVIRIERYRTEKESFEATVGREMTNFL